MELKLQKENEIKMLIISHWLANDGRKITIVATSEETIIDYM